MDLRVVQLHEYIFWATAEGVFGQIRAVTGFKNKNKSKKKVEIFFDFFSTFETGDPPGRFKNREKKRTKVEIFFVFFRLLKRVTPPPGPFQKSKKFKEQK